MGEALKVDAWAISDMGRVREDNQDSVRSGESTDGQVQIFAVADGMGGYEFGGVASVRALEVFFDAVSRWTNGWQVNKLESILKRSVQDANLAVYQEATRRNARMGTTLTAACLIGNRLAIAHVGDSRAYLIRDGAATVLTRDHTAVGELVRARVISPEKARTHAQRSVLNRCLGVALIIQVDVYHATLQEGDVLILCSDGLWASLSDAEIATMAAEPAPNAIADRLVLAALDAGSDDNVSALAVCIREVPDMLPQATQAVRRFFVPALRRAVKQTI